MFDMRKKQLDEFNVSKIFKNSGAYAILLLAVFAMVFFGICNPQGGMTGGPRGTAARVDEQTISGSEFRRAYQANYEQYSRQFGESFNPAMLRLADMTMNQLIDQRLGVEFASSLGVVVGDDEIIEMLGKEPFFKDANGNFSRDKFEQFLRGNGYSEASLMEEQRRMLVGSRAMQLVSDLVYISPAEAKLEYQLAQTKRQYEFIKFDPKNIKPQISDQDVQDFLTTEANKTKIDEEFAKRSNEFNQPERIKARHILIAFKGARSASGPAAERSKEEAKKLADQALKRVQAAGADFAKIATEMTDEPAGKTKGGDLGEFSKEDMVKEFSDAAFALQPGEIAATPVESPFGFHVIKVEGKTAPKTVSLEDAKPLIARDMLIKQQAPQLIEQVSKELLAALKENNEAQQQEIFKKWNLKWETTDMVALEARNIQGIGSGEELNKALVAINSQNKLAQQVVVVNDAQFILRLKTEQAADMQAFNAQESDRYRQMLARMRGYSLYNELSEKYKQSLEKKGRIWKNQDYLAIDNQQQQTDDVKPAEG